MVCNADEGEPGTFKDRVLLQSFAETRVRRHDAGRACVTGAQKGMLYLRGEYRYLRDAAGDACSARARAKTGSGANIGGAPEFRFRHRNPHGRRRLCLRRGIRADRIAGRQAGATAQPPAFPGHPRLSRQADRGEQRRDLVQRRRDRGAGRRRLRRPGNETIDRHQDPFRLRRLRAPRDLRISVRRDASRGARGLRRARTPARCRSAARPGICLAPEEFGRRIAFEDMPTAGAFMVFDDSRDMFEVARNFAHFFAHESCGFCTPCRVGTSLLRDLMDKIAAGHGAPYEFNENRCACIASCRRRAIAAWARRPCNPVFDTMRKFQPAYERRLQRQGFRARISTSTPRWRRARAK